MTPRQLLDYLETNPEGYQHLLVQCGGIVAAGYRLAVARLECWHVPTSVPTVTELHVAMREAAERGGYAGSIPSKRALVSIAQKDGFQILPGRREKWT